LLWDGEVLRDGGQGSLRFVTSGEAFLASMWRSGGARSGLRS
jgi:hypothetical protein